MNVSKPAMHSRQTGYGQSGKPFSWNVAAQAVALAAAFLFVSALVFGAM